MNRTALAWKMWNLFASAIIFCHVFIIISFLILILNYFSFFKKKFQKHWFKINYFFLFLLIIFTCLCFFLFKTILYSIIDEVNCSQRQEMPVNFFFTQATFVFTCEVGYYLFFSSLSFLLTKYNLLLWMLFVFFFPIIFFLLIRDYSYLRINFFCWIIIMFMLCFFLIAVDNLIAFFIIYILLITLFIYILYLSLDYQEDKKILIKYFYWTIISFISLILGSYFLISLTNQYKYGIFFLDEAIMFDIYRTYYFYFFCFSIKLSFWPFWHWLFRIHTKISIGLLIFINCILIKIIYFCLFKFQLLLSCQISFYFLIFICFVNNLNLLFKFKHVKQFRTLITYSSIMQANLTILFTHIDSQKVIFSSVLYIWCHSFAIASLFLCIYLLEKYYNTENNLFSFNLFQNYYDFTLLFLMNIVFLLDYSLTFFFWYQFWKWISMFNGFFYIICIGYFCTNILFIFFFLWYFCNLFIGIKFEEELQNDSKFDNVVFMFIVWLSSIQIGTKFRPSILLSIIYYFINSM